MDYQFNTISNLRDKGIDVNNVANAVTAAEDIELDQAGFEKLVFEISGQLIRTQFDAQAKIFFINFVNQAVTQYAKTEDVHTIQALRDAEAATEKYFSVFHSKIPAGKRVLWKAGTIDEVRELTKKHAAEYTRPVSKQARAIEIVKANPNASSRELQAMFIEQLGLTQNGAATYVYNVKKIIKAQTN